MVSPSSSAPHSTSIGWPLNCCWMTLTVNHDLIGGVSPLSAACTRRRRRGTSRSPPCDVVRTRRSGACACRAGRYTASRSLRDLVGPSQCLAWTTPIEKTWRWRLARPSDAGRVVFLQSPFQKKEAPCCFFNTLKILQFEEYCSTNTTIFSHC